MKGKCGKFPVSHVHWFHFADAVVLGILTNNQNGLSLVLQFCTNVTARVVVILVQMQDGVDVEVIYTCPCHEDSHNIRGFLAVVDVIHEVSQSVYDNKTYTIILAQGIVYDGNTQFRSVFSQPPEHEPWVIFME